MLWSRLQDESRNIAARHGRVAVSLPPSGITTTPPYWSDEFEGEWLTVFAGSPEGEPGRGAFLVGDQSGEPDVIQLAPEGVGALTLLRQEGEDLVVGDAAGWSGRISLRTRRLTVDR